MSIEVVSPVKGVVHPLAAVPDPVFAASLVGAGVAVQPDRAAADVLAPIAGHIAKLHAHAFVVVGQGGRGVLVHLGIDTIELQGAGFTLLVEEGDAVDAGAPVVRWDPAAIEAGGRSAMCLVIALDAGEAELALGVAGASVEAGEPIYTWH